MSMTITKYTDISQMLTYLRHSQMPGVALPAVQAAAVRTHFELILVASLQGADLGLVIRQRHSLGRPV